MAPALRVKVSSSPGRPGDRENWALGELPGASGARSVIASTPAHNMKFFKIFKKKPPPSPSSPNLICNIHWAEVQRELSQDIMKDTMIMNSNTANGNGVVVNNKNAVRLQNNIGWNSAEEDNFSSEANSWSSISLSSSSKSNVQENLQEENFSRYVNNLQEHFLKRLYFANSLHLTYKNYLRNLFQMYNLKIQIPFFLSVSCLKQIPLFNLCVSLCCPPSL